MNDYTEWVLDHVVDMFPGGGYGTSAIEKLIAALAALRGEWPEKATLFGLWSTTAIADERRDDVVALIRQALHAWREWSEQNSDGRHVKTIDRALDPPTRPTHTSGRPRTAR